MSIDKNKIEALSKMPCKVAVFDSVGSTNDVAKELAIKGEKEGTVVVALSQTGGRGRLGRSFFSPNKTGIYMSIILRPEISYENLTLITPAAAVAVYRAIAETLGKQTQIKWVNDIYYKGKKVAGILTETVPHENGNRLAYAVLGIGINVLPPENDFPEEIESIAGALLEKGEEAELENLIGSIINNFFEIYSSIEKKEFLKDYKESSLILGKDVLVLCGDKSSYKAKVLEITDRCSLKVLLSDGTQKEISTGEVSLKI